jgi:zinc protease
MIFASVLKAGVPCLLVLAAGAVQAADIAVTRQTTPGGLSYLHAEMPDAKTESIQLIWRDGTTLASPDLAFLGGIAPSLLADGPKGESRAAFSERMQDIRTGYSWGLGNDGLQLSVNFRARTLGESISALAPVIADPALDAARFEELRKNLALGAAQAREPAEAQAGLVAARLTFGNGPMYRLQSRDPAIYDEARYEALISWRQRVLGRDNLIVAAAGTLKPDVLGPQIDRLLAGLPQAVKAAPSVTVQATIPGKTVILERPTPQTVLLAGGQARIRPGLDAQLVSIATQVLHGGFQSRLYKVLREKLGATYGVSGSWRWIDRGDRALYGIRSAVDHDRAGAAIEALRAEYALWWEKGITADELADVRGRIRQGRAETQRSPSSVAATLAYGLALDQPDTMLADAGQRLEAITVEDVNSFIRQNMPKPELALVIVAPDAKGLAADCIVKSVEEVDGCRF